MEPGSIRESLFVTHKNQPQWAIGFFGYAVGGFIPILLVLGIILFLLKVIKTEA